MPGQIDRLLSILARLRDREHGCDWDRQQTFASIAPYTIEEAYEVADAIARGDMTELREELGDLLLQVAFHSRMAEEDGHFAFDDVARAICDKMEARHPHVFANTLTDTPAVEREVRWEAIKAQERSAKGADSAMDGIARALPALLRAEKLQKRAARHGFDWPDPSGPAAKLAEEVQELADAPPQDRLEEAGDLLFAAVNVVRAYGIAPEDALRAANEKFETRYRSMEALAGGTIDGLSLDEQETLWQRVKAAERAKPA